MKVKPLNDRVLVKRTEEVQVTKAASSSRILPKRNPSRARLWLWAPAR